MTVRILSLLFLPLAAEALVSLLANVLGFERRANRTGFWVGAAVLFVLNAAAALLIRDVDAAAEGSDMIVVTAAAALPYFLLKPKKKLTFALVGLVMCATVDYAASLVTSFASHETAFLSKTVSFCCMIVFSALIHLAGHRRTIPEDFTDTISPAFYAVVFAAELSSYYKVLLSRDSGFFVGVSNVLTLLSAAMVVACFSYLAFRYANLSYRQKEAERQLAAELKHYEDMMQKNRDIRRFKHDYQNNLFALSTFLQTDRKEEALDYIEALTGELKSVQTAYATGNYLADAILSEKAEAAARQGTSLHFTGTIPADGIPNSDLCLILSNTLDNAIRACSDQLGSAIRFSSTEKPGGVVFTVSNPVKQRVAIHNNTVNTTKKDAVNHGLGLTNVKKAAQRCGGSVQLTCTDDTFTVRIGLILNVTEETK